MAAARDRAAARGALTMMAPVAPGGSCRDRYTYQPSLYIRSPVLCMHLRSRSFGFRCHRVLVRFCRRRQRLWRMRNGALP